MRKYLITGVKETKGIMDQLGVKHFIEREGEREKCPPTPTKIKNNPHQ